MPPKATKRKRSENAPSFRFQAITLYATFPQCDTPKEKIVENLKSSRWSEKTDWWIVCNELHQDGNTHSHILIKFKAKIHERDSHFADFLSQNGAISTRKHGNYQCARDVHKVIEYIKKTGNYIDSGNLPSRTEKISTVFAKKLVGGSSLKELLDLDPGYCLANCRKIRDFKTLLEEVEEEEEGKNLIQLPIPIQIPDVDDSIAQVVNWCNTNLFNRKRPIRSKQLWIKSGIGYGKTTWLSVLQRFVRCYIVGYERDTFDDYRDNKYDLIVFDEYKNQKKLEFLNSLIDGQQKRLDQKYGGTVKKVNLPVVFLSNYLPIEAYTKAATITLDAFIDRLLVVELTSPLFPFIDYLNDLIVAGNNVDGNPIN